MGICPQCGSFVDEGDPYCPDCSYIFGDFECDDEEMIKIGSDEYSRVDVEDVLSDYGYDLCDLEDGEIDEEDFEDIVEDLRFK